MRLRNSPALASGHMIESWIGGSRQRRGETSPGAHDVGDLSAAPYQFSARACQAGRAATAPIVTAGHRSGLVDAEHTVFYPGFQGDWCETNLVNDLRWLMRDLAIVLYRLNKDRSMASAIARYPTSFGWR